MNHQNLCLAKCWKLFWATLSRQVYNFLCQTHIWQTLIIIDSFITWNHTSQGSGLTILKKGMGLVLYVQNSFSLWGSTLSNSGPVFVIIYQNHLNLLGLKCHSTASDDAFLYMKVRMWRWTFCDWTSFEPKFKTTPWS